MIADYFQQLNSSTKRRLLTGGASLFVVLIGLMTWEVSGRADEKRVETVEKRTIQFDGKALEEDIRTKVDSDIQVQKELMDDQNRRISQVEQGMESMIAQMAGLTQAINSFSELAFVDPVAEPVFDGLKEAPPAPPPEEWMNPVTDMPEPVLKGSIGERNNPVVSMGESSKKKQRTIRLPPSFMKAKLLTGIEAEVSNFGSNNPEQILLRVQAPAVLPNEIRANLKGCFVVGNSYGRLNKERVDVRLVSMHCLSHGDHAVVEADLEGFVVDGDGKKGMAGIVVSKAGSHVARLAVAGVLEGLADGVTLDATQTSVSPLGMTRSIDKDKALNAGVGKGAKKGLEGLSDIYLDLASQTTPVIEVGTAKEVTVVLAKTAELTIREFTEVKGVKS